MHVENSQRNLLSTSPLRRNNIFETLTDVTINYYIGLLFISRSWHTKMCTLMRHIICESFCEDTILQTRTLFNYVWKYPKNAIKSLTASYLTYWYIKMCVLIRHMFCESLVNAICVIKHKYRSFLWYYFQA